MNNQYTETQTPYQRKVGFFGSVKQLGVTTVSGINTTVTDSVTIVTGVTGALAVTSTLVKSAVTIWGDDMLEDLQADSQLNRLHRKIDRIQQEAELDALELQLKLAKAKRTATVDASPKPRSK